ncbi:hypothetical protein PIB30_082865 [Stylosanthes scabra]|uniref:Uncharacterized protein n=1 Tax=Stylosanthes scabra TaxID=79078 RepID=A0ABU6QRN3_9FABA|nr:hypothetical protein [Stylosanthes scabra]
MANKNGCTVTLAITVFVILAISCSAAMDYELHETIRDEVPWTTTSYSLASNSVKACSKDCKARFENNQVKHKFCIQGCIIYECSKVFRREDKKRECFDKLNAKFGI